MIIPASKFTNLPEGCPVRWGSDPAVVVAWHSATEYRVMVGPRRDFPTVAAVSQLSVDLTTPAAVRAFAPELIAAVRGLPDRLRPLKEPYPVWDAEYGRWILVDYLGDESDNWHGIAYQPGPEEVSGPTPAACLMAGLKAALDAAKDAQ